MTIPLHHTIFSEEALIEGCKEGNAQAQKALYQQYAEPLLLICLRYANNREDAKDLLMQAMLTCFKNIAQLEYRGPGSLQAWLRKVTVNQCLMALRKQRQDYRELDSSYEEELPAGQDNGILSQLSAKEIMRYVHELPPGYRAVFNLYVFEDMSHREIAVALGITESTSKSQLHKARTLLQNKITGSQSIAL